MKRLPLYPHFFLETFSGLSSALWGVWLLLPWHTFTSLSPVYHLMERVAPEEHWGAYFLGVGVLLLVGVWRRNSGARMIGAIGVLWGRLFIMVLTGLASGWQGAGTPDFFVWSLMAGLCFIRSLHDVY